MNTETVLPPLKDSSEVQLRAVEQGGQKKHLTLSITIVDYGRACYILAYLRVPDLTLDSTFLSTRADIDILLVDLDS